MRFEESGRYRSRTAENVSGIDCELIQLPNGLPTLFWSDGSEFNPDLFAGSNRRISQQVWISLSAVYKTKKLCSNRGIGGFIPYILLIKRVNCELSMPSYMLHLSTISYFLYSIFYNDFLTTAIESISTIYLFHPGLR